MKYKILLSVTLLFIAIVTLQFAFENNTALSNTASGPAGRAGDPAGGNLTCKSSCHTSGPTPTLRAGWITSNVPSTGYVPGTVYTVTATATAPGHTKFGFEISPQSTTGTFLGTMAITDATNTQLISTNHYITHKTAGTTGTTGFHTWSFNWTAPVSGSGRVIFYGAFNITNANNASSGDTIALAQLAVTQVLSLTATSTSVTCNGQCNGSASITAVGGTTPYTYSWSSGQTTASVSSLCAATYTVTVTDAAAQSTSQTVSINQPAPVVPAVSINSNVTTVCAGSSITFTATPTNGGATPAYQWKINGGNAGTNAATFSSTSISNGDVVTCLLTSNAACASPTTSTSNGVTVTVIPVVTPTASIISDLSSICSGSAVTFIASATNAGNTPVYQWKVNGVNAGSNSTTFSSTSLTNAANVTCVLTSNATCASPASVTSNGISISVHPILTPSISISSSASTICSGNSVQFNASVLNEGLTSVYQWKINGLNAGTNSTSFASTSLVNSDIVTCQLISSEECVTTSTVTSNAIAMSVLPLLTPSISIISNVTSICSGTVVNFTSSFTNAGSTPLYNWKINGINAGTNTSTFSSSSLTDTDTVSCELVSSASCASPANTISNNVNITVFPVLLSAFDYGTSTICQLSSNPVPAITGAAGGNFSVTPSGAIVNNNTGEIDLTSSATGTYTITYTSPNPCTTSTSKVLTITSNPDASFTYSSNSYCINANNPLPQFVSGASAGVFSSSSSSLSIDSISGAVYLINSAAGTYTVYNTIGATGACSSAIDSTSITLNMVPTVTVNSSTICSGQADTLFASGASTYLWAGGSITPSIVVSPSTTTNYTVTGTSNGCSQSAVASVTVNSTATPTITQTGFLLTSSANSGNQWYLNGSPITGVTGTTYSITANGLYTLVVTENGCASPSSAAVNILNIGITENSNDNTFSVFPNPSEGIINIEVSGIINAKLQYTVYNVLGKILYQSSNAGTINSLNKLTQIDLSNEQKGIYFLRICNEKEVFVKKIIFQ